MALSRTLKESLLDDAERIHKIVDRMVKKIERQDIQGAEYARAYWAAHIKSALGNSYGGLMRGWDRDVD